MRTANGKATVKCCKPADLDIRLSAGHYIPPNATNALTSLYVFVSVVDFPRRSHSAFVRSYQNGAVLNDLKLVPDVQNIYNAPSFTAHRATFHSTLLKETVDAGVLIKLGRQVTKDDFPEASVHLANGDVYKGDIVLRTYGEKARCRELMLARSDSPCHNGGMIIGLDINP